MIKNLDAVAFLAGKPCRDVHQAWKLAKRTASADLQRGNYVLAFKTMCMLLKIRHLHLPDKVGDRVFLFNELLTITEVTPDIVTLTGNDGKPRPLPLLNLILCERRQPSFPSNQAKA